MNTSVLAFFDFFSSEWKDATAMLNIEKFFFWVIIADCWSTLRAELIKDEDKRSQFDCLALVETDKIEMSLFNQFEKTISSCRISNNRSFLFIHDFSSMILWWSISAINIETVSSLWSSMIRFDKILWVMIFFVSLSSYSHISFSFVSEIDWISSFWHIWSTSLMWTRT